MIQRITIVLLLAILLCEKDAAIAQDGQLDPWFNTLDNEDHGDGFAYMHTFYAWNAPNVSELRRSPDGHILAVGQFTMYNGRPVSGLAKIDINGKLVDDLTPSDAPLYDQASDVAVWNDGSMVIIGGFTMVGSEPRNRIARLHADGSLDLDFDPGIGVNGTIDAVAALPDGKTLIAGGFSAISGIPYGRIARLLPDGSPDPTFNSSIGVDLYIATMKVLPDGKILIAGNFSSYNGTPVVNIARLLPDGSLDPDFDPGMGPDERIKSMDVAPDGSIWITGLFFTYDGTSVSRFARLTADGALHPEFIPRPANIGITAFLKVDGNGNVFLARISSYDGVDVGLAKIAPDGNLITSFDTDVPQFQSGIWSFLPLPDGRLIIGGEFIEIENKPKAAIACLLPNGALDHSFNPSRGPSAKVNCLARDDQERILVGGDFTHYNDLPTGALVRLNADGTIDPTFITALENSYVNAIHSLPDGKILVGGGLIQFNGATQPRLVRLLPDGTLDPTFDVGTGPSNTVHVILVDDQGRIYIGGDFNYVDGTPRNELARLLPDGALDLGYGPPTTGVSGHAICFDPMGRIMVKRGLQLVRLNEDGSEDTTYISPMIYGGFGAIVSFPDGSVLLGGWMNLPDQLLFDQYLVKLDPMGVPDLGYMSGIGPDRHVETLTLLDDGKVMIGGWFSNVDGLPYRGLARLNLDGSLDQTFASTPGTFDVIAPVVKTILPLPQEKLLIGGGFTSYNGTVKNRLARIMGGIGAGMEDRSRSDQLLISPNPTTDDIRIKLRSTGKVIIMIYDALGKLVISETVQVDGSKDHDLVLTSAPAGLYTIVVSDDLGVMTGRVVKN